MLSTLYAGHQNLLYFFMSRIRSVTTDMGTEINMTDAPNIVGAFLRHLAGAPLATLIGTVDLASRLMPRALKIPGWSHLWSNMIKHACYCVTNWLVLLPGMRNLTKFFRNESWRLHIVTTLESEFPGVRKLLESFSASMTKWRYETVFVVIEALLKLRYLCQTFLINASKMFNDFKGAVLLSDFVTCCKWDHLWEFMDAFLNSLHAPLNVRDVSDWHAPVASPKMGPEVWDAPLAHKTAANPK